MRYALVLVLLMSVLVACSGGGDDNDDSNEVTENTPAPPVEVITGNEQGLENVEVGESGELDLGDVPTPAPVEEDPTAPTRTLPPPEFEPLGNIDDPESLPAATGAPVFGDDPQADGLPLPGTLEAARTPEVEPSGDFTYLSLQQTGGPTDIDTLIEVFSDGRVLVDGQQGNVGLDTIGELQSTINEINYFAMRGTFRSTGPTGEDDYTYQIWVEAPNDDRLVNAQDGFMPPEIIAFIRQIIDIGSVAIPD